MLKNKSAIVTGSTSGSSATSGCGRFCWVNSSGSLMWPAP